MRRQGNLLKVSVQLIDGNSGLAVWQKTFERGRRELLNVQQDVAQSIAEQLLPDTAPTIAGPITQDATAHDKMILARHYEQQVLERETVDPDLLERAVRLYREATELDPGSALAHSRLAGALLYLGDIDDAEAHASKALLLDPKLAEVQHTFGKILFARGTPNMGEPLARAVELNPNLPDAIADYAFWHWFNVSTDGVADLYQRALDLDPLNVARYAALGQFLALNDRPDEARALAERLRALLDTPPAYRAIEKLYDLVGDVDHAIAWAIKARDAEPDNPLHVQRLAELYTDIGDYKTAEALEPDLGVGLLFKMRRYDEMIVKAEDLFLDHPEDLQLRVYLGFAYNAIGQFESAIRVIETSGFLDSYSHSRRSQEEFDGFGVLLDAAYGSGEIDRARELAVWELATHYESDTSYWFVAFERACTHAILGNDDEVYRLLQRTLESELLAWEPMLRDHQCFKRFTNDAAYLAVVNHFEQLREMLRARLPSTLAQYGVVL